MSDLDKANAFAAPWRERLPNGELGAEYGPSPATYHRRWAAHRNWAHRPPNSVAGLRSFVAAHADEIPARELECYQLLASGLTHEQAAERMGTARGTIGVWIRRLRQRAERAADSGADFARGCKPLDENARQERLQRIRQAAEKLSR